MIGPFSNSSATTFCNQGMRDVFIMQFSEGMIAVVTVVVVLCSSADCSVLV